MSQYVHLIWIIIDGCSSRRDAWCLWSLVSWMTCGVMQCTYCRLLPQKKNHLHSRFQWAHHVNNGNCFTTNTVHTLALPVCFANSAVNCTLCQTCQKHEISCKRIWMNPAVSQSEAEKKHTTINHYYQWYTPHRMELPYAKVTLITTLHKCKFSLSYYQLGRIMPALFTFSFKLMLSFVCVYNMKIPIYSMVIISNNQVIPLVCGIEVQHTISSISFIYPVCSVYKLKRNITNFVNWRLQL